MENIKNSFENVRRDIYSLQQEISLINQEFSKINQRLFDFSKIMENFYSELNYIKSSHNQINKRLDKQIDNQTDNNFFQSNKQPNQTIRQDIKALNNQNLGISIGNKGVSTDRQTNRQTDRHKHISNYSLISSKKQDFEDAGEIIKTLSNIQEDLKKKFKDLTNQEMIVFSSIYQLEEEYGFSDYKTLSSSLNLSESSIRDYVSRLIRKGIPLEKEKIHNKEIKIKISPNLKKIASLSSILKIRDL